MKHDGHDAVLKAIRECTQLERLCFDLVRDDRDNWCISERRGPQQPPSLECLKALKNLKDLRIFANDTWSLTMTEILPELSSSLEVLDVVGVTLNMSLIPLLENLRSLRITLKKRLHGVDHIAQLKHLTDVHFHQVTAAPFDLIKIVKSLPNLTKLMLYDDDQISQETYDRIVDVVEARTEPKNRILDIGCPYFFFLKQTPSKSVQAVFHSPFPDFMRPY